MKVGSVKSFTYEYNLSLTEKEYNRILKIENDERAKGKLPPMTRILSVSFSFTDNDSNYSKDNLSFKVGKKQEIER